MLALNSNFIYLRCAIIAIVIQHYTQKKEIELIEHLLFCVPCYSRLETRMQIEKNRFFEFLWGKIFLNELAWLKIKRFEAIKCVGKELLNINRLDDDLVGDGNLIMEI